MPLFLKRLIPTPCFQSLSISFLCDLDRSDATSGILTLNTIVEPACIWHSPRLVYVLRGFESERKWRNRRLRQVHAVGLSRFRDRIDTVSALIPTWPWGSLGNCWSKGRWQGGKGCCPCIMKFLASRFMHVDFTMSSMKKCWHSDSDMHLCDQ